MRLDLTKGLSKSDLITPVQHYAVSVETAFPEETLVGELLEQLKGKAISHEVQYFYAIDTESRLTGIISTRDLLFSRADVKIGEIALSDILKVQENDSLEKALKLMAEQEILALPVIDKEQKLTGIFEIPFLPKEIDDKQVKKRLKTAKEVFQLIGLTVEQGHLQSSVAQFRYRMPWLLCNLLSGLICAAVADNFQLLLDDIIIIAMFIPLVLTLGESISMQSMTLSLQFLQYGKTPWRRVYNRLVLEWKTAALLGATCAFLVALVTVAFQASFLPIVAISSSIFLSMIFVSSFGLLMPVVIHMLSLDPKVAGGPVVLMLTDVAVTAIYLGLANKLLMP
ncbi:MAG: hypothetical protein K0S07_1737 [Chlamydiales bacterium]|nr:hypothetical protein [Chlamydiales bacterium]